MNKNLLKSKQFNTVRTSKIVFGVFSGLLLVALLLYVLARISGGDGANSDVNLVVVSISPFFFIDELNVGLNIICDKFGIIVAERYVTLFLQLAFLFFVTLEGVAFIRVKKNEKCVKDIIILNKIHKVFAILVGVAAVFEIYAVLDVMIFDKSGPFVFLFGLLYAADVLLGLAFSFFMYRMLDSFIYVLKNKDDEFTEDAKNLLKSSRGDFIIISVIIIIALIINCFTSFGLAIIYSVIWIFYIWSIVSANRFVTYASK